MNKYEVVKVHGHPNCSITIRKMTVAALPSQSYFIMNTRI